MSRRAASLVLLIGLVNSLIASPLTPAAAAVGFTLTVTRAGNGGGSVTGDVQPGIDCGSTCVYDFPSSTLVTLTATANADSTFTGWTGDCSGTGTCQVTMDAARSVSAEFALSYRPDAWIKLCGLSDGCTIHPLPHPWKGQDVYNKTGAKQTVSIKIEEGEGVRYWMTFENDGVMADTITIQGCKGNGSYKVNKVTIGFTKRPVAGTELITNQFKAGTASFDLGPASAGDKVELTLNIVATTKFPGVSYTCPITVISKNDPTAKDRLVTKMITF